MFRSESTKTLQPELIMDDLSPMAVAEDDFSIVENVPANPRRLFAKIRDHEWITGLLYTICDVICWVLLYATVGYLRRDVFFSSAFEFVLVDCVVLAVIIQALYIIGGYSRNTETRSLIYATEHILAVIGAAVVSSMIIYSAAAFEVTMKPSRGVLLVSFTAFLPISLTYRRFLRKRVAASTSQRTFLVVGSGELAREFYEAYKQSPNHQRLEFVDDDPARVGSPINGGHSPVIEGDISKKLAQLDGRYSGVILAQSVDRLGHDLIERLVRTQFQKARVYTLESFYEAQWRHVPLHTIDPVWPLQMGFQLARVSPYHYLKRLCDIVLSALLLLIFLPLLPFIILAIWLENGRPAFFNQTRVGREGERFVAYKFRTMSNGAEKQDDIYTRKDDARITRVGRWLRRSRLDELPQLWNVLKGNMSLIGPRAEWVKCVDRYEKSIPFYHFRHLVKPGITGWAQVNYPYGESDEDAIQKLQYDLYYIRHYSLKLDTMILLKTIHTMAFVRGR
jgi:exopolysaccharide biosynthesis polyprenyl glycosylphosphotransferase